MKSKDKKGNSRATSNRAPVPTTVGDLLIHYLKIEGVKHIFGIPGGGLLNLLENFKDNSQSIEYFICRHETGATYIADGYFRATGKIGVVAVTTGPGATNALTGVMNAQADGSALMLICGEVSQQFYGEGYLQEGIDSSLNLNGVFENSTGFSCVIDSGFEANTLIKQAFRSALSMPRQAVHISIPVNVSVEDVVAAAMAAESSNYRCDDKGAPIDEATKAMTAFLSCKRPLLFLGNGCREALRNKETYSKLLRFAEDYGIPVVTTADGKGVFPESHELSMRVYGIAGCMWPYDYMNSPNYDGIMVIGSSLGSLSTNTWLPLLLPKGKNAPFIQVDINQKVIGRSFEITHGIVSEAGAFINDLGSLMEKFPPNKKMVKERKQEIATIKKQSPFLDPKAYNSTSGPVEPAAMMRVLQKSLPAKAKIFIDAGNCVGWSIHYLFVDFPSEIFTSLSMGPMGFGVGSVIGGKIGCPDETCIGIVGDAAFMMYGSEVSTAKQYKVGAIWLVLYDNNLSMVSQGMDHFKPDTKNPAVWSKLYELGNPDLAKFAESLGAETYTINTPAELEKIMPTVLKRANKDHLPQVIIANINTKSVPPYYNPIYSPGPPH